MIASAPHVRCPPRLQATIGNVPCSLRRADGGARRAGAHVEHPAGTERDLGQTGSHAALADEAAPAGRRRAPPIGGAPGKRGRLAEDAGRVDDGRQHLHRDAQRGARLGRPRGCVARQQTGDGRVRRIGDVHRAAGQHPRNPGVDGAEAQVAVACAGSTLFEQPGDLGRRLVGRQRQTVLGFAVMQSNTVRRSCQPSPGPIGWPVLRSQTSVEARWLVIPTASTGPAAGQRSAWRHRAPQSAIAAPSNSTRPGNGVDGGNGRYSTSWTAPSPSTTAARNPDVPTSTTSTLMTTADWMPDSMTDEPAAVHGAAEPATDEASHGDGSEVEHRGQPVDVVAADAADRR